MLQALLTTPHRTALLIDREYSTLDDDPVLAPLHGGKPFDLVKKWKPGLGQQPDAIGESVGFFRIHSADIPALIRETCAHTTGAARSDSYDEILRALVKEGRFAAVDVTGLPWTEIDFPHDLEYARKMILPKLLDT
jgi:choline kinase